MKVDKLSKEGLQTGIGIWSKWEQTGDTQEELDPRPFPRRN